MSHNNMLTYFSSDIAGYTLLTQNNQREAIRLLETYQVILIPLIEKEGGSAIVCIGDAVTACFSSCHSAVRVGFAIQQALNEWNKTSSTEKLTTRIGLHCSRSDKGDLQQLSKTLAKNLESLGSINAICVSLPIVNALNLDSFQEDSSSDKDIVGYCYSMGDHDLEYLPDPQEIFYLYEENPGLLVRIGLKFRSRKSTKTGWGENKVLVTAMASMVLFVSYFFLSSAKVEPSNIEIAEVEVLSDMNSTNEYRTLIDRINLRLADTPGLRLISENSTGRAEFRLQYSIQVSGKKLRLSWGLMDINNKVQTDGGIINVSSDDIEGVEGLFIKNVTFSLNDADS